MQSDLIIINDFCDRCHVDPSFITELEEDGLIEVLKSSRPVCR